MQGYFPCCTAITKRGRYHTHRLTRKLAMAATDFREIIESCRSIKTGYSRPFQGLPNTINLSRDGGQVLFVSGGSLYSYSLPYHDDGEVVMCTLIIYTHTPHTPHTHFTHTTHTLHTHVTYVYTEHYLCHYTLARLGLLVV